MILTSIVTDIYCNYSRLQSLQKVSIIRILQAASVNRMLPFLKMWNYETNCFICICLLGVYMDDFNFRNLSVNLHRKTTSANIFPYMMHV